MQLEDDHLGSTQGRRVDRDRERRRRRYLWMNQQKSRGAEHEKAMHFRLSLVDGQ